MLTKTNQYTPSDYDLEPARISKIAADNLSECLEHQGRVEAIADFCGAVADVERGIEEDLDTARRLRHMVGDYRIDDLVIDRRSGCVCRIVGVNEGQFRCLIVDHRGNGLLANTSRIYLDQSDIA